MLSWDTMFALNIVGVMAQELHVISHFLIPHMYWLIDLYLNSQYNTLYLLVSTRAVIGQFSGPYSPVRPAKI